MSQDEKANKYDRQLRLWGDHGQSALELAKVCLVNATATGTEILKNLILPGVGSFTIVDAQKVSGEDAGNNFFLDKSSIGQSRAQVATEFLLELNEDVCGDYIEDTVDILLEKCSTFFTAYQLVIVTNLSESRQMIYGNTPSKKERSLLKLAAVLWENDIPLLVCRSYGFIGYLRLVVKEHTVVESHPDNVHDDLRLDRQFSGLAQFCDSLNLSAMTKKEHSHTPWLILLYKYIQIWKEKHDGLMPSNYKEKCAFKDLLKQGVLINEDGVKEDEENFTEAVNHVNTALLPTKIPEEVQAIFEDDSCANLHAESKPFWILARAVREFVNQEGQGALPLRGAIPDMTADSERYIQLQSVYREKANHDVSIVTAHVHHLLQSLGRDEPLNLHKPHSPASSPASRNGPYLLESKNKTYSERKKCCRLLNFQKPNIDYGVCATDLQNYVTDDNIKMFCKNAAFLRVLRCRSLATEYEPSTARISQFATQLDDTDSSDLIYYILLRAVDRLYIDFNRYPGEYPDVIEMDIPALKSQTQKLLQEWSIATSIKDEFVHEMCRYGASELPSVAAFLGGVAAQEAIKIITEQFIPVNNTFIYNGIKQTSSTFEL